MSASSKKKLRKEAEAALLTEKQKQERAEAKKLKTITVAFVAVMLVVAITAAGVLGVRAYNNSGIITKNTIAAVTGEHKLNSVQMNYYFTDYVKNMYAQWETDYGTSVSMYMAMMGLDLNAPLDAQTSAFNKDETWAQYFLKGAVDKARTDYALYDKAMAEGFTLPEADQTALDSNSQMLQIYAMYNGYKSVNKYLQAVYGPGSDEKSFNEYSKVSAIASAYYNAYSDSLSYTDANIREYEKDKFNNYSSFSYALYAVNNTDYLPEGTKDENGTVTHTDAQKTEAQKKAEEIANQLKTAANLEELDKAIAALEINKDKETTVSSTKNDLVKYTDIPESFQKWLADAERKNGDITVITNETKSTDADGKETTTVNGYYVICFMERNDNTRPLANVRHLLVQFEGGTTDAKGNKKYSDAEKATAKAEAERLLNAWKEGDATEATFIDFVKEHTDDAGSKETGGLYEDIHPESNYVENFRNWALDVDRKPGDTGVIVSDYGYHVMYYSSDDVLTYRDHMITEDMRAADVEKWYNAIIEPTTITTEKTSRLNLDLIVASFASATN